MREFVEVRMLQREGSIQSGEEVILHHETAAKLVAQKRAAYAEKKPARPVERFPLLNEYVAAGYLAETYEAALAAHRKQAEANGHDVEVRDLNASEKAQEAAALKARLEADDAARAKELAEQNKAGPVVAEAHAEAVSAASTEPVVEAPVDPPAPAPALAAKPSFFSKRKKG